EICIYLSGFLWSLFPVITTLTFSRITPLFSAAISTLLAAVFFAAVLTAKKQWPCLRRRNAWKDILLTSLYIGVIFYGLIFLGIRRTTAGNASIMSLMEILFSFLILGLFLRHEKISVQRVLGGICMAAGALVILLPKASGWHSGDLLVVLATLFPPLGNKYAQQARRVVSAECIMFCRSVISGCFLLLFASLFEPVPTIPALSSSIWFLLVNGLLLLGLSKILWIDGIHLIPITKAISLESITPLFTLLVAFLVLHEPIFAYQILGLLPIMGGIWLLTKSHAHLDA
ncbi:MAG: DMT family transporter, partial [Candidatus Peribacteraceae bacterium]|nr:DMT family transporter [Candidatus Peribacteraceae bacterium]